MPSNMQNPILQQCYFSDLPEACFTNAQARELNGVVHYCADDWSIIEQWLRIHHSGIGQADQLEGLVLNLKSVPAHLNIHFNESHQTVSFGLGVRSIFGGWNVYFHGVNAHLIVGNHSTAVGARCDISSNGLIQIGDDCMLSMVHLIAGPSHQLIDVHQQTILTHENPRIILHEHVWLAQDVIVLSNTEINMGSIVGTQSIVQGEFPAKSVLVGCPAKKVRDNASWSTHYSGNAMFWCTGKEDVAKRLAVLEQSANTPLFTESVSSG